MKMSTSISRTLIGLGVASTLLLGCQQLAGREDASGMKPDGAADAGTTPDLSLALRVKPTEECLALHRQILAADSAGETEITLQGDFARLCLEELRHGPDQHVHIPPELLPGKPSRCRWLIDQVDSGNVEYVVKLLYHCPEACDTSAADSSAPRRPCPEPKPKPDCPALIAQFDTLDTASREYPRLKHFLHHHCGVIDPDHPLPPVRDSLPPPPPRDTLHPPRPHAPTLCDSIHVGLAGLDRDSDEYAALKATHDEVCHLPPPPRDSLGIRPPKDSLPPPPPPPADCEGWMARLETLDPDQDAAEIAHLERHIASSCPADP